MASAWLRQGFGKASAWLRHGFGMASTRRRHGVGNVGLKPDLRWLCETNNSGPRLPTPNHHHSRAGENPSLSPNFYRMNWARSLLTGRFAYFVVFLQRNALGFCHSMKES